MPGNVRFGVIGCGEIAVQTCQGIAAAPNAEIAMLMDTRPEVLRDLAEFYGVPTTTDVEAVLSNPEVDAVYIA
ncbi:MAG: Gfo/Idh/MocA family oxidoreductase, partial [Thermoleophilia bacterium]|nr:Gfo/Idh/MocA family oxidoreductase [Thermoleophilia bacterium]